MLTEIQFFLEVLISGLMTGVLYSLIALGFVLIYKASGMLNFAQGAMVLFAVTTLVGINNHINNLPLAIAITICVMVMLAHGVEFSILRRTVNRSPVNMFMATIGLSYVLLGLSQLVWGAEVHVLDIGLPTGQFILGEMFIDWFELSVAALCGVLVLVLAISFQRTRIGLALRAVADDHQAAISLGISIRKLWIIVWSLAGVLSILTGVVWGTKLGVQPALSLIALKAMPVMVLGGLNSIPGAILAGLFIGASEKLFEVYVGSALGGATESWIPYVVTILVLLVRPSGFFGTREFRRI